MTGLEVARGVADAVLSEGYLLYPYRASATKNQQRWQFGVLVPPGYAATGTGEHDTMRTECLWEAGPAATLHVRLRFLWLETRHEPSGDWDEAVAQEIDVAAPVAELLGGGRVEPFRLPAGTDTGADGVVRQRAELRGQLRLTAELLPGAYRLIRVRAEVANTSAWSGGQDAARSEALRHSLVATHTLLAADGGEFLSLLDPPEWAAQAAAQCANLRTWPVLVGEPPRRDLILSCPIILYDYPKVAPESPQDLFDCTEIDELLSLRTLALTEAEKQQARATDPRAAALIDQIEQMPPELLSRLHGAIRSVRPKQSADPVDDTVLVAGHRVGRGWRVRLHPGPSTDAQDMFLTGRTATVHGVKHDVDGRSYLAVTLDDDLGADLYAANGRFRYFDPSEVEPLQPGGSEGPPLPRAAGVPHSDHRVLVAGIGNIFLGDDGFGVELARRLAECDLPAGVRVADYGISGVRLAYDLLGGGYQSTVLLDASPRGEVPGTVSVVEIAPDEVGWAADDPIAASGRYLDAHGMQPDQVLALLRMLGGEPGRVLLIGCEPVAAEPGIGLSEPVRAAVAQAVPMVCDLLNRLVVGEYGTPVVPVGEESGGHESSTGDLGRVGGQRRDAGADVARDEALSEDPADVK